MHTLVAVHFAQLSEEWDDMDAIHRLLAGTGSDGTDAHAHKQPPTLA